MQIIHMKQFEKQSRKEIDKRSECSETRCKRFKMQHS